MFDICPCRIKIMSGQSMFPWLAILFHPEASATLTITAFDAVNRSKFFRAAVAANMIHNCSMMVFSNRRKNSPSSKSISSVINNFFSHACIISQAVKTASDANSTGGVL